MFPSSVGNGLRRLARHAIHWKAGVIPTSYRSEISELNEGGPSEERLERALSRAFEVIPHYRELWGSVLGDGRAPTPEDLPKLPILEKYDLREHGGRLAAEGTAPGASRVDFTGGSTGEPTRFLRSRRTQGVNVLNEERVWRWCKVEPGARQAFIWGSDRDLRSFRSSLANRLLGYLTLDAFRMEASDIRHFADALVRFGPEILYGYSTALARVARTLRDDGIVLETPLRAVRATAERLTERDREDIAEVFRAPVFDFYGSRELGPIATELAGKTGLHVFYDLVHVEIVDADGVACGSGEVGDILVTSLVEDVMPLVRFRIGDRACWLQESGWPVLGSIQGRVGDFVVGSSGQQVHAEFFAHLLYGVDAVARYRVHQETNGSVTLTVEGWEPISRPRLDEIAEKATLRVGYPVRCEVVGKIPPAPSGKHVLVTRDTQGSEAIE